MKTPRHLISLLAVLATGVVVGVTAQQSASADVSSGDRPVLIQITPCRLADSRPAPLNVGSQLGKLTAQQTVTFDVQATNTDCAGLIPADAVGLSTNMTSLGATSQSFYTVWPSGPRPDASSLNPAPGEPATPNAVATPIDAGKFNVYNNRGENHIIIDINGYYINHNHDDLYGGTPPSATAGTFSVGAASFDAWESNFGWQKNLDNGLASGGAWITSNVHGGAVIPGLAAPIQLPHGATITSVIGYFSDESATTALSFQLRCHELDGGVKIVASGNSAAPADIANGFDDMSITTTNAVVDNSACSYFFLAESGSWATERASLKIRGVSITTT